MKYISLPLASTTADAIILANGDYPSHPIALSILNNNKNIICCDGAIEHLSTTKIQPKAIVGDCDSLSNLNKVKYASILHPVYEQDTNDLTKSVNFCIEHGFDDIIILGATGKREDHTIANIALLSEYAKLLNSVSIITNYGVFNAIDDYAEFESFKEQQVSIFCISPCRVSVNGLKYQFENKLFTSWWQATLNESLSTQFSVKTDARLVIFRAFDTCI